MYSLHQTYFLTLKRLDSRLQKTQNLTFSRFLILLSFHCKGTISQQNVANFLHLTEATVSRHINGLTKEGLLKKTINVKNRREHILSLTDKGKEAFKRAHDEIESELEILFDHVTTKERDSTSIVFEKIITKLNDTPPFKK